MNVFPPQSEKAFTQQVIDIARRLGWLCYHTWRSDHSEAGFPDMVLVKGRQLIFAECKTERGKVSEAQARWLEALRGATPLVGVWRPNDMDHIIRLLGGEPQ